MKKKLENRRNGRLIVSPIRKFPRGGGGNFCLAPIFEHGHCRAVGHSSWNESRDTIVSTGRNKSSFRSVRPRVVPFPRISPILARSNVRALIVHWFLSKEKRDRGKKREKKKKRRKKGKKRTRTFARSIIARSFEILWKIGELSGLCMTRRNCYSKQRCDGRGREGKKKEKRKRNNGNVNEVVRSISRERQNSTRSTFQFSPSRAKCKL